jgi:predicted dinucleotide-binding enzyme
VSTFGSVPSEVLFDVFASRSVGSAPAMLYCGDSGEAKETAATLIHDAGFTPIDVGGLSAARYIEPSTMLMARLAYEGEGGPAVAYRFERFGDGPETVAPDTIH